MSSSQSVRIGNKVTKHSIAFHEYMEQEANDAAWQQLPFTAIIRVDDSLWEWRMCRVCGQYMRRSITAVSASYAPRATLSKRQTKEAPRRAGRGAR